MNSGYNIIYTLKLYIIHKNHIFTQIFQNIYSTVTTFAKFFGLSGFIPLFIER